MAQVMQYQQVRFYQCSIIRIVAIVIIETRAETCDYGYYDDNTKENSWKKWQNPKFIAKYFYVSM